MKHVLNKKGLTLMEVIISLFIFTILSVGFYSLFTNVYINTYRTTNITEEAFLSQRELEDEIANTKTKILLEESITYDLKEYELFKSTPQARDVKGYYLTSHEDSIVLLETLVALTRPPKLKVPKVNPFEIATFQTGGASASMIKYPNIGMNNFNVDVDGSLSTDNDGLLIRYLYYWYVSDSDSYTPFESPTFPDNFELIPDETSRMITNIKDDYAGRFVTLVVTPVGERGQMGESVFGNDIYISQFKKNNNLAFRLDASYFNFDNSTQVTRVGLDYFVNRWQSVVPTDMGNTNTYSSTRPYIKQTYIEGENTGHNIYEVTSGNAQEKTVVVDGTNAQKSPINGKTSVTVYLSLRLDGAPTGGITLLQAGSTSGNGRWTLEYNNSQLTLTKYINNSSRPSVSVNVGALENDQWAFVRLDIYNNQLAINVNNTVSNQVSSSSVNFNNIPLTIKVNNKVGIGDLLIYDAKHDDADRDEVFEYFTGKYYPN